MSRGTREHAGRFDSFAYGAVTHFGGPFQAASARDELVDSLGAPYSSLACPTTPTQQRARAYTVPVWAVPLSLAATQGIEVSFSSSGY